MTTRTATTAKTAVTAAATVLATFIDLFLPVVCAGCTTAGVALCVRCAGAFDGPFDVHRTAIANGPPVHALAAYGDVTRTVVLSFKERGRRDLAEPLGRMLAAVLPTLDGLEPNPDGTWWLVPAPSRARAARRRGGFHMLALARCCAAALARRGHCAAVAPALRMSNRARDSAGLTADARAANLAGRIRLDRDGAPPPGTSVVLLDDVVTTGATAAACVATLAAADRPVTAVLTITATKS